MAGTKMTAKKARTTKKTARKGTKKPVRKAKMSPRLTDSMVADAVMANIGTGTMVSMAAKGRSSKLGAGMATMMEETKAVARAMAAGKSAKPCKTGKVRRSFMRCAVPAKKKAAKKTTKRKTTKKTAKKTAKRKTTKRKTALVMSPGF